MLGVAKRAAGREHLDIEFIQAGIEHGLPVEAGLYDLAVCALVLCHVPGLADVAREFHRALRPGGLLLITDFHPDTVAKGVETQLERDGVTYRLPNEPHTRDTYLDAVEGAGFELVEMLELPTRKADRERFEDEYWFKLADTHFCMIILAQKRS